MATRFGVQPTVGMQLKTVFQSLSGANFLTTSEVRYVPRVGEQFRISGKTYTIKKG
jgi:hypothetical protein